MVGEAADGAAVLPLAETLQPDLIMLDLSMPRLGGLEILPLMQRQFPQIKVLILTMHDDEAYLRKALRAGAAGYVLKKAANVELLTAIQAVMRGEIYVHPTMTHGYVTRSKPEVIPENGWQSLSEREQEVLHLVALGHTGQEIAAKLTLSVKTVETYRSRGMEKLGLKSRAALVRFALDNGLLD